MSKTVNSFLKSPVSSIFPKDSGKPIGSNANLYNTAANFISAKELIGSGVVSVSTSLANMKLPEAKEIEDKESNAWKISIGEGNYVTGWKLVSSVSARLLCFTEDTVMVECLIDREQRIYAELEFEKFLFEEFELLEGKLFKISTYERPRQKMIEVMDNPNLVSQSDFPKIDFVAEFKSLPLKKRI